MSGRAIVVGDPNQSLYRFRGADSKAFPRIAKMLERNGRPLTVLTLPVNYRCDDAIIQHAQQWVPELRGASKATGVVDVISFGDAIDRANNDRTDIAIKDGVDGVERTLPIKGRDDVSFAFLCRTNLPLIITAYKLIGDGKRVCIIGRSQIGQPLKNIIKELCGESTRDDDFTNRISDRIGGNQETLEEGLLTRLATYHRIQAAKLRDEKYERKLEALDQNVQCIEVICERVKDDKVSSVISEIDNLFTEEPTPGVISLSTIHRAKGLEWDVVFILRPDLMPHPLATPNADGSWSDEQQQEQNAQYVAATRTRSRLYYVHNWPFDAKRQELSFDYPAEELGEKRSEESISSEPSTPAVTPNVKRRSASVADQLGVPSLPLDGPFLDDGKPF